VVHAANRAHGIGWRIDRLSTEQKADEERSISFSVALPIQSDVLYGDGPLFELDLVLNIHRASTLGLFK